MKIGEYICEARNHWGVTRCSMRLDVRSDERSEAEEAPRIVGAPASVVGEPGMPIVINVKVSRLFLHWDFTYCQYFHVYH